MKRKIMMKIGKDSSFFAKRKLNYLYSIKKCNDITVWFILTLTAVFVPIFVNSAFLDMKHTLRYDGEVNIGKSNDIKVKSCIHFFLLFVFNGRFPKY